MAATYLPTSSEAFVEEGSAELEKLEDAVAVQKSGSLRGRVRRGKPNPHTIKGIAKGVGPGITAPWSITPKPLLGALPRFCSWGGGRLLPHVNAWLMPASRADHIQDARADITHELPSVVPGQLAAETAQAGSTDTVADIDAPSGPRFRVLQLPLLQRERSRSRRKSPMRARGHRGPAVGADHFGEARSPAESQQRGPAAQCSHRAECYLQQARLQRNAGQAGVGTGTYLGYRRPCPAQRGRQGVRPDTPMDALEMDQYSGCRKRPISCGKGKISPTWWISPLARTRRSRRC